MKTNELRAVACTKLVRLLVRNLERISLWIQGWRPRRIKGRGDGKLWFWLDPVRFHLLERELAYEVAASRFRRKPNDEMRDRHLEQTPPKKVTSK